MERWFKLDKEGPPQFFFELNKVQDEKAMEDLEEKNEEGNEILPEMVYEAAVGCGVGDREGISGLVEVDDDNEPAPENQPNTSQQPTSAAMKNWGFSGVCYRRQLGPANMNPRLKNFPEGVKPTPLYVWELLFPKQYVQDIMIPETNKTINGGPLTYPEYIKWVGLWFMMATTYTNNRRNFWSSQPYNMFDGAPFRFNTYMTRYHFEQILHHLKYTNNPKRQR